MPSRSHEDAQHNRLMAGIWFTGALALVAITLSALAYWFAEPRDPHVVHASSLRAAAQVCADRDFPYIAKTRDGYYCLQPVVGDPPEALSVAEVLK